MARKRTTIQTTTQAKPTSSGITSTLQRYESEISSFLGILVALALAGLLMFFVRRSLPQPATSPQGETTQSENTQEQEGKHIVIKGEGLWQIAQQSYGDGYKWTEIAKANNLKAPYNLSAGQELTIPDLGTTVASPEASPVEATAIAEASSTPEPTASATSTPQPTASSTPQATAEPTASPEATPAPVQTAISAGSTYTVKKGDHLWKIAVQAYGDGYKWTKIYEANKEKIRTPGYIEIGWELTIPNI